MDTVVLDVDGTLLDSNYHHTVAWARAFENAGITVPLWRIHGAIGMGGDKLVAVAGDDAEREHGDEVRDRWEQSKTRSSTRPCCCLAPRSFSRHSESVMSTSHWPA